MRIARVVLRDGDSAPSRRSPSPPPLTAMMLLLTIVVVVGFGSASSSSSLVVSAFSSSPIAIPLAPSSSSSSSSSSSASARTSKSAAGRIIGRTTSSSFAAVRRDDDDEGPDARFARRERRAAAAATAAAASSSALAVHLAMLLAGGGLVACADAASGATTQAVGVVLPQQPSPPSSSVVASMTTTGVEAIVGTTPAPVGGETLAVGGETLAPPSDGSSSSSSSSSFSSANPSVDGDAGLVVAAGAGREEMDDLQKAPAEVNADVDSAAVATVDGPAGAVATEKFEDFALLAVPIAIAILGLASSSTYANPSNDDDATTTTVTPTSTSNVDVGDDVPGDGLLRDGIFSEEGIAAALAASLVDGPTIKTGSPTRPPVVPEEDVAIALAATLVDGPTILASGSSTMTTTPINKSSGISMANVMKGTEGGWKMDAPIPYGLQVSTPKWSSLPPPPPPKRATTKTTTKTTTTSSEGVEDYARAAMTAAAEMTKTIPPPIRTVEELRGAAIAKGYAKKSYKSRWSDAGKSTSASPSSSSPPSTAAQALKAAAASAPATPKESIVSPTRGEGSSASTAARTPAVAMMPKKSSGISMANVMKGGATAAAAATAAGKGGWKFDAPIPYGLQGGTPKWSTLPLPPPPPKKVTTATNDGDGRPLSSSSSPSSSLLPSSSAPEIFTSMPKKSDGAIAKSYSKSSYKTKSPSGLDASKSASSLPPSPSSSSLPSTAASASSVSGTIRGGIADSNGDVVDGGDRGMTGSGAGIDSNISGNMPKGQIGASSIASGGLPYGTSGGMMKGASSRGIVDSGGSDRSAKTYAKSSLKGFAAAAAKAGPVGGGYLTDLSNNKETGSDDAMMNGNDISAAVGVGGKTSTAPTGVGGEAGSGRGGVLKGTTAAAVSEVKKGYFGKSSAPKLSGKSINNAPPFLSSGGEGGGGMFKTTRGKGVGAEKSPTISMANIMKGWTREGGSESQSTSSGSGSGNGYLPNLVQSKEVISTSRNPSLSSPLLLVPKGSSPDQQPDSPSSQTPTNVSATVAEGVGGISKEEQLSQKLKWLQASASSIPQQLPPLQQQQQQQQQQPIGQFGTLTRNTGRIGSATRLGSLASFGNAIQGLDNRGGRGVPAGPGAAAVMSGLPPYEEKVISGPSAGGINTGRVESSAVGGGGEGGGGAGRPLSVTITDPRTGKKRTISVSNNLNP